MTEHEIYDLYTSDIIHEEMMIERKINMERKIIDLKDITFEIAENLKNYVWTKGKLIPAELLESK